MNWNAINAVASVISMVAFVATALYVRGQLRHQEKERYLSITGELFSLWQSRDFMDAQLWLLHRMEEANWEDFVRAHRGDYGEAAFHRVGSFYDRVGTLVRRGLVDEEEILSTIGAYAIAVWQKIDPLVREARRIENSVLFDDFERLLPACYACYVPALGKDARVTPFALAQPDRRITAEELARRLRAGEDLTLLDVRGQHAPGEPELPRAVRIPLKELSTSLDRLPKSGEIITFCG